MGVRSRLTQALSIHHLAERPVGAMLHSNRHEIAMKACKRRTPATEAAGAQWLVILAGPWPSFGQPTVCAPIRTGRIARRQLDVIRGMNTTGRRLWTLP